MGFTPVSNFPSYPILRSQTKFQRLIATAKIQEYRVQHEDTSFVLVDTPGFDDTDVPDEIVLQSITEWLTSSHHDGWKLNGILYLHRITDVRM